MNRSHNFSAGPAILPLEVLQKAQEEFLDYRGSGSSIIELSHRGTEYTDVDLGAREKLKQVLGLGDDFEIYFLQGGASMQFTMVPCNFLGTDETADYILTGSWAKKAFKEAKFYGQANNAFSSEDSNFSRVPTSSELRISENSKYVHFTSNNTIFGTQFRKEPVTAGVPLVCDASSDFLSRPLDMAKYGLIYAGAQKNAGPAGLTVVIIRKDFLGKAKTTGVPTILSYHTHTGTLFNTPPVFAVYMFNLVLDWLIAKGGLDAMDKMNHEKGGILYNEIDRDGFYNGTAAEDSRSLMNVTFRLPTEELEKDFLAGAKELRLSGLKGHRSVGGMRASIYNACPKESVQALVDYMADFRKKRG